VNKTVNGAVCAGILTLSAASVDAALLSRLGGLAVYDTDLDITWLADSNAGAGSAFDDGTGNADGFMTWNSAIAWAASLNVGGFNDWRLPTLINSGGGAPCTSLNCTDIELGHLFYDELGGTAGNSIFTSSDPDLALFTLTTGAYWSDVEPAGNPSNAFFFGFVNGAQFETPKGVTARAWAVRDGDVGTVPEPSILALLGIGLIGFMTYKRNRQ